MVTINEYLQNKGFQPNKAASTSKWTAYNIDAHGKVTLSDNLIVNNYNNTWRDKANNAKGNIFQLVINLNDAYDYRGARKYLNDLVVFIKPWVSGDDTIEKQSDSIVEYKEETLQYIYKLQTLALMVRNYFDGGVIGKHYMEEFSFDNFIDTPAFREYYNNALKEEALKVANSTNKVDKVKERAILGHNAQLRGKKKRFPHKSIEQMMQEEEDKYQEMIFTIEENNGDVEKFKKEYYDKIRKEILND